MLELLLLALWGNDSQEFLANPQTVLEQTLPGIGFIDPSKIPQKKVQKLAPKLIEDPGLSVMAKDLSSGKILFEKDLDITRNIASLTKIMTYLIIRESHDLSTVVMVDPVATKTYGAQIDLYGYEQLTLETLLEAILIPSANDAAQALAIFDAGSEAAFVKKMNEKAKVLGLSTAQFYNATGLDIEEKSENGAATESYGNKMSARDLMKLTRIALKDDFFRKTVAQKHFYGTSVDEKFFHEKASTNQLLETFVGSKGIKTGYTLLAGQCFINLSENNSGEEIITIILGSSDRFTETKNLMSWILDSFWWQ